MDPGELLKYVTNTNDQVFAIKNLQGVIGAVMARYSRAETGLRETLVREFIKADKLNFKKAGNLIERVLIAYGDDSVGELEGAHLSFEGISMLATKVIEHRRIGGSPIEQSTRYIRYDFKNEQTGYHYYTPPSLTGQARVTFCKHIDIIFDCYAKMWSPLIKHLQAHKPIENAVYDLGATGSLLSQMGSSKDQQAFRRTWHADLKAKACDILRAFLPLASRANVGVFGNGRYFQHLISKMLSSSLPEAIALGNKAHHELTNLIPHYVKRAGRLDYLIENEAKMRAIAQSYFADLENSQETVLVEPDANYLAEILGQRGLSAETLHDAYRLEQDLNFVSSLVYSSVRASFCQIRERVKQLPDEARKQIMHAYYGNRRTRRDRPERGIEHGYSYTFDIVSEWAVYKDLMRHRMGTIQVQKLAPDLGFVMPDELVESGLDRVAEEAVASSEELFQFLSAQFPQQREYAILQGHRVRWLLGMNDRALMHMLELRTAPQGHPNYRLCCQNLYKLAHARFPERINQMSFVNTEDIYWSRAGSEARQRVKENALDQKLASNE